MPTALKQPPHITSETSTEGDEFTIPQESSQGSFSEAALAAQIQQARQAARQSIATKPEVKVRVRANVDVIVPSTQDANTTPQHDETSTRPAAGDSAPTGRAAPTAAPAGELPPQTMLPGGGIPGGGEDKTSEEDDEKDKEGGEDQEGNEDKEGEQEEGEEGGENDNEEEGANEDEEGNEAGQQAELEHDKAEARNNKEEEGDKKGNNEEKSAGDKEAENEGLIGAVPNPEDAFVYGSRASLTASFYELPTLLKGNIGPLLYIHTHFIGYYLLPDIPFLALIPFLQTKKEFEKPNAFHNVGFLLLLFLELLIFIALLVQLLIPFMIIYAIVALASMDWEQVTAIFSLFSGFSIGKTLFNLIRGFF